MSARSLIVLGSGLLLTVVHFVTGGGLRDIPISGLILLGLILVFGADGFVRRRRGLPVNTWSPFQSPEVKEICAHMTPEELAQAERRAGLYGCWAAGTFALPAVGILTTASAPGAVTLLCVALVFMHVGCLPLWLGKQRRFLASTAWAISQSIQAEHLRLFSLA